jgi:hypothetical protein
MRTRHLIFIILFSLLSISIFSCENRTTEHDAQQEIEEVQGAVVETKEELGDALEPRLRLLTNTATIYLIS